MNPPKQVPVKKYAPNHAIQKKRFNENGFKYFCCRGKYHVRKGAIIIGILELGAVGIIIVYCIVAYLLNGFYKTPHMDKDPIPGRKSLLILALAMSIIAAIIWSLGVTLTAWGIRKSKPGFLIPHMMIQILAVISLAGLAALFVWWVLDINGQTNDEAVFGDWDPRIRGNRQNVVAATIIFSSLAAASMIACFLEIFCFYVVRRCFKYLSAKMIYQQQRKHPPGQRNR